MPLRCTHGMIQEEMPELCVQRRNYHVDDDESWQRGAAGSRRQAYDDGLTQDGGVVWRRGEADDRPCKVIMLISPEGEGGMELHGGSGLCCAHAACTEERLDRFVLLARCRAAG